MLLQDADVLSGRNTKLLMIFIGMLAFAILAQTIIFLVMAIGLAKTQKKVMTIVEQVHEATLPTIKNVGELVRDTSPKVKSDYGQPGGDEPCGSGEGAGVRCDVDGCERSHAEAGGACGWDGELCVAGYG